MSLSGLFQFILGFILGVVLLAVGATGVAYIFFARMAAPPPKPMFSEHKQEKPTAASTTTTETTQTKAAVQEQAISESTPEPSAEEKEELPSGAYRARVTWPQGLSLREEPTIESNRVGGVDYNRELIVLEDSDDKKWQRVRLPGSGQEAWVKAGNVKKIEDEE